LPLPDWVVKGTELYRRASVGLVGAVSTVGFELDEARHYIRKQEETDGAAWKF